MDSDNDHDDGNTGGLSILNPVPQLLAGSSLLHDLISAVPDSKAVAIDHLHQDGSRQSLTYDELHSRSNKLAIRLISLRQRHISGSAARFIVPLYIPQSPELYVSQLAILKAGGAFCPIALDVPEERLRFILIDIEAEVILTTLSLRKRLPDFGNVTVLTVDDEDQDLASGQVLPTVHRSQPAYVLYTSGSTGQPKGVVISHSAATQAVLAHNRHIPSFCRFLQFASPTFDVSIFEIFFPLYRGCTLVSCDRTRLLGDLPGVINQLQIDAAELTPSVANALLQSRRRVPSLKLLLTIGEMLTQSVIDEFAGDDNEPGLLYGMYGPTEATIHCTLQTAFRRQMSPRNIGVPLDTVSAFIIQPSTDAESDGVQILPLGADGELAVGGHQLADGYLNRPEQTDAAFVEHPRYGRLYRTGDRAKMLPNGKLECLGRISSGQVKLRGQRIELGEIEHAASRTAGCQSAVAEVIDNVLVAFCTIHNTNVTGADIRQGCSQWLPSYMVPAEVLVVESFPYLASGKLDRATLRDQYRLVQEPPSAPLEFLDVRSQQVAKIVVHVLGVDVNESTTLQSAGLDSLIAIRLATKLRQAGFRRLDAAAILRAHDMNGLRAILFRSSDAGLTKRNEQAEGNGLLALVAKSAIRDHLEHVDRVFVATPIQSAMLIETAHNPEAYCNWVEFDIRCNATTSTLQHMLMKLSDHHQLLRAGFLPIIGFQTSHAVLVWKAMLADQVAIVDSFVYDFSLRNDSQLLRPCRFQIRNNGSSTLVLLQIHHALYDQWSIDLLKRDLTLLLSMQELSQGSDFGLVSDYYDQIDAPPSMGEADIFWQRHLQDCAPTLLLQQNGEKSALSRTPWQNLGMDSLSLQAKSQRLACSVPAVFEAAAMFVLSCYLKHTDVILGTVFSGRHIAVDGIEDVFGPCLTTLPVRSNLVGSETLSDFVGSIHETMRLVQRYATTSLTTIKSLAQCQPGSILFDTLCIWQETSLRQDDSEVLVKEVDSVDRHEFNLVFEFEPRSRDIRVRATYQQKFLPKHVIDQLLQQVNDVAHLIIGSPQSSVASVASRLGFEISQQGKVPVKTRFVSDTASQDLLNSAAIIWSEIPPEDLPWTAEQRILAAALAQVLRLPEALIEKNKSFFAMGLHSLNAMTFGKAIQRRTHNAVATDAILRNPTIVQLASAMQDQSVQDEDVAASIIPEPFSSSWKSALITQFESDNLSIEEILSCTPLQEALLSASERVDSAYTNTTVLRILGDLHKMQECWIGAMARHAILRTIFVSTESPSHPYAQIVLKQQDLPWLSSEDLYGIIVRPEDTSAKTRLHRVSRLHPWWIETSRKDGEVLLTLQMHHALYDGMAMSILLEEIERTYKGEALQAVVPFGPFLAHIQNHNDSTALAFWSSRFSDLIARPLPNAQDKFTTDDHKFQGILQTSSRDLHDFCKQHAITPLSVFQAAWAKTLSVSQGISDVCFGNVVSGRSVPMTGVERLVAPCFNTTAVRINLTQATTNIDIVQSLHRENLAVLPYQLTSLRRIQAMSTTPDRHLFESLLLLQPPPRALDEEIWTMLSDKDSMDVPLTIEIVPLNDCYRVALHFMPAKVEPKLAQQLLGAFDSSVAVCIHHSTGDVKHLGGPEASHIAGRLRAPEEFHQDSELHHHSVAAARASPKDWTTDEMIVRDAFAKLSAAESTRIQRDTSLYQLGLDSLNAAQIATQLRGRGLQIDPADVMEHRTPYAIAAKARENDRGQEKVFESIDLDAMDKQFRSSTLEGFGMTSTSVEAVWPCTSVQGGMLAQSLESDGALYVNHMTYRIPDGVDLESLRHAWKATQRKHQVLRMGFSASQASKHPFVLLIYRPDDAPINIKQLCLKARSEDYEAYEDRTAAHIVNHIHLHAWRLAIWDAADHRSMCLSIHHALYDAESLQLILHDLEVSLSQQLLGPSLSIGSELAATLSAVMDKTEAAEQFWRKVTSSSSLAKFPDLAPNVVPKASLQSVSYVCKVSSISVEQFCQVEDATVQALGQAAWALLLAAYTGEPIVTFGTVFSTRATVESHNIAFPGIVTVPISSDTRQPMASLLRSMVDFNSVAQRYRFTPLAEIQQFSGLGAQNLFDTVFVYRKARRSDQEFSWPLIRERASVDYAASLELELPAGGNITIHLTYDDARIPEAQGGMMLRQFENFLCTLTGASNSYENTRELYSIVAAKEEMLPTQIDFLHQFVEATAMKNPEYPALEFVDALAKGRLKKRTWTYRQLNERSNQVANLLCAHSIKPGSIVAVCMDKYAEASFAFIGILKAGCSFLAMDPGLPTARHKFIMQDSQTSMLFIDSHSSKGFSDMSIPSVCLEADLIDEYSTSFAHVEGLSPSMACYVLYTSGTTGNPKGCEITHRNAVQAMLAFQRLFAGRWDRTSKWLQFASYWFDVSVLEQFWSWSVGVTVVGAPRDLILEDIAGFIRATGVTHIDLTPSLARLLHPRDVPTLHKGVFIMGGEALKQEIIDTWGPVGAVCNGYGPTEATIGVTMNTFINGDAKPSNIGRQFDNVGSYVLAPESEEPVLRGSIGELCVSGPLVGRGYLNRPDLTRKLFPTLARHGERVYRTGDLVRLLWDGSFAFIGRKDTQTKLRGQRLEAAEIDSVIKGSSDWISEVVSIVHKTSTAEKEVLISFVTNNTALGNKELAVDISQAARQSLAAARWACQSHLPGYMVPTHIIPVSALPLTVNNKSDIKRLVSFFDSLSVSDLRALEGDHESDRALNTTELKIRDVIGTMLALDETQIGRTTNLFSIGLSSVSAITLASLLKSSGIQAASVALVMRNPSLGQLARSLSGSHHDGNEEREAIMQSRLSIVAYGQRHTANVARKLSLRPEALETVVPCTPLQEGLLLDSNRLPERPYFNQFRFALTGIDLTRLESAFNLIAGGIQMLRTRFLQTPDGYAQCVLSNSSVPWIEHGQDGDFEGCLQNARKAWLQTNIGDLIRPIEVHVRTGSEPVLVINVHHALYDGMSWDLLIDRLAQTYASGRLADCGPAFTDVLPYGLLTLRTDAKTFWTDRLADFCYVPMTSPIEALSGTSVLKREVLHAGGMETLRNRLGVSHQAILQACFEAAMLSQFPDTQTYGSVVSGRSVVFGGADLVIGPLFNTLPYSLDTGIEDSWAQYIQQCHDLAVEAIPYQHTPLRTIRTWLGLQSAGPMFDVLFICRHQPDPATAQSGNFLKPIETEPCAEYPVAFEVTVLADSTVAVEIVAQANVADATALQALFESFQKALQVSSEASGQSVARTLGLCRPVQQVDTTKPRPPPAMTQNGIRGFAWDHRALTVRSIIGELAGLDSRDVDEHSTIFSLGLDSIDAVKLASRLKKSNILVPVSKILQAQTIPRILDAALFEQTHPSGHQSTSRLKEVEQQLRQSFSDLQDTEAVERLLPATPNQEALVAVMLQSDFTAYYNHDVLCLRPEVNLHKLKAAFQTVVDRTPILRTRFLAVNDPETDAAFVQVVHRPQVLHFQDYTSDNIEGVLMDVTSDVMSTFALRPPTRFTQVQNGTDRYIILSLAHAQYDGHSLALLHADIQAAYHATLQDRPVYDGVLQAALDASSQEARDFWSSTLSGALPSQFPLANEETSSSRLHRAERHSNTSANSARSFCQKLGVSMQTLAQVCWTAVLASYTRNLEVLFGVVLACRDSEDAEQVMFPCMNTLVTRMSLHGTRLELLRHAQSITNDILPYQRTPLRTIQASAVTAFSGRIFDTLFLYQHQSGSGRTAHDLLYDSVGGESSVEYPVAVEMEIVNHDIIMRAACKGIVLDEFGTNELLERLDFVLNAIVTAPEESTVRFNNDKVSICGLHSVKLQANSPHAEAESKVTSDAESEKDFKLSETALRIRDALAQVAKVPGEDILPSATIESISIDSISAIKVASLLRKRGIPLSVSQILKAKTLRRMALATITSQLIDDQPQVPASDVVASTLADCGLIDLPLALDIDGRDFETILPATAGQLYMLSAWQHSGGQLFYPTFRYELHGVTDKKLIDESWSHLVALHPILRTVLYATADDRIPILQVVMKQTHANHFATGSVDRRGTIQPMIALRVHERSGFYEVELKIHHALYDAVSLALLMQDFQQLLEGLESISQPRVQYHDFVALSLPQQMRDSRKAFWTTYLSGTKVVQLRQSLGPAPQRRVEIFKPRLFSNCTALETVAKRKGVTIQALLFASYAKVYVGFASGTDGHVGGNVVLGIYLANRSHLPELDSLRAPTLNLVPLRVRNPSERPLLELAKQVQTDLGEIGTMENSAASLAEISEWTGIGVDTFVNFVKLPEQDGSGAIGGEGKTDVVLKEMDERRTTAYSRVIKPDEGKFVVPKELEKMKVMPAYQHSVDLEATISNGALGIGIFCPEQMLGLGAAEDALEEVKTLLEKTVGKSSW